MYAMKKMFSTLWLKINSSVLTVCFKDSPALLILIIYQNWCCIDLQIHELNIQRLSLTLFVHHPLCFPRLACIYPYQIVQIYPHKLICFMYFQFQSIFLAQILELHLLLLKNLITKRVIFFNDVERLFHHFWLISESFKKSDHHFGIMSLVWEISLL